MLRYIGKTSMVKIFNSKVGTFLMLILAMAYSYDKPYLKFVQEKNYPISWCIFPFHLASPAFLALFLIGIIYINSDVPFMQHVNMYQAIRTGRKRWALGQIGGIAVRSFVVTTAAAALSAVPFLGKIEWTAEWGKMIYTLSAMKTQTSRFFLDTDVLFRFFYEILGEFTPLWFMAVTVLLCTLLTAFLGILMFVISLYAGRIAAVCAAFCNVLLLFMVQNAPPVYRQRLAHFVPAYWGELALLATPVSGYYRLPSLSYMFAFLVIASIVMACLVCRGVKRMDFNWENEDL